MCRPVNLFHLSCEVFRAKLMMGELILICRIHL
uniref:Uncharacterized protein n=1 Tax=Arundo donax TaxID=35708 RepID=A0A0A9D272_ARUDO